MAQCTQPYSLNPPRLFRRRLAAVFLLLAVAAACGSLLPGQAADAQAGSNTAAESAGPISRRVLIFNSYHPGMTFSDEEVRGIRSTLTPGDEVFLEYMDAKRIQGTAYTAKLAELYAMKYLGARFDAVFSLDDDALRFLLQHGGQLFPDTPVVFCGVNALQPGMLDHQPLFTGVLETIDIEASIDFALRMLPKTKQILVITDPTTTGAANRRDLERLARSGRFAQPFVFLDPDGSGLALEQLLDRLQNSPPDSIVYHANFYKDKQGNTHNIENLMPLIAQHAPGPVFVHNGMYLGHGALGGKLNSGYDQGVTVGRLAGEIWNGRKPSEIDLITENGNRVMVDHRQLARWGIPLSSVTSAADVSADSIILFNKPEDFWRGRGLYFLAGLSFILLEGLLIGWLIWSVHRQRQLRRDARMAVDRFRALFDLAPFACAVNGQHGRYLMVNRAFSQITGVSAEDALGRTSREAGVFMDKEAVRIIKRELAEHGSVTGLEVQVSTRSGAQFHTLQACAVIDWDDGPVILSATADITQIREAERALRQSEERYRELVENASIIILKIDTSGVLRFANSYALKFFGFNEQELVGRNVLGSIVPLIDSNGQSMEAIVEDVCRNTENLCDNINENITRDGRRVWIHWNNRVIRDENGQITEIFSFGSDVTKRKQAEEEQEKLRDQLLQAQKMESIGRLAGGVAHDFNNMLGVIIGHAELALDNVDQESRVRRDLEQILAAAERSADLTRQLLAFARKQPIAPKVLDLNQSIAMMLTMLRRLIGEQIELCWKPGENLWPVLIDPTQITQIFANLSINAKDAVNENGRIVIETANVFLDGAYCAAHVDCLPGEYVVITVSDNGCGMDQSTRENAFEPFFTTKKQGQGTGLGLATVSGIVTQNNGFVHLYSEPGLGSTFRIYLPRFSVGDHAPVSQDNDASAMPCQGSGVILLVEDEQILLEMTQDMLESLGYVVLTAASGAEALRCAQDYPGAINLLITDVIMPGMNGKELVRKMAVIRPSMRSLFMSGYTADVIAHQGVLDRGVQFVQKPFTKMSLATKVREVLL